MDTIFGSNSPSFTYDNIPTSSSARDRPSYTTQFACGDCGKIFSRQSHLEIHSRTHSGIRPYVCPICKRGFTVKCNLERHMITHMRNK